MKNILSRLVGICLVTACAIFAVGMLTDRPSSEKFSYNGPYVDIVAELARRNPDDSGLQISKIDTETGMACAFGMKILDNNGSVVSEKVLLQMPMEEGNYTLAFEDDRMIGYFSPNTSAVDRLQNRMETDEEKMAELLDTYKSYIEEFSTQQT